MGLVVVSIAGRTRRRWLWVLGALVLLALLAVPLPFYSVHQGVVWLPDEAIVRAPEAAVIDQALVPADTVVAAGTPLLLLDSLPLRSELAQAEAAVAQTAAQLRRAETDDAVRAAALRAELAGRTARLTEAQRRSAALQLRAAVPGRWVPAAPTALPGRFAKRGEVLGSLVAGPSSLVRVAVTQDDLDLVRQRGQGVQVRLAHSPRLLHQATVQRQVPGGAVTLISAALGTTGGGDIAVDPTREGGTQSLRRVFDLELALATPSSAPVFGDRATVRFDLGHAPLAWQWLLRVRQLFLARLSV